MFWHELCLHKCQNCAEFYGVGLYYKTIIPVALVIYKLKANWVLSTSSAISSHTSQAHGIKVKYLV